MKEKHLEATVLQAGFKEAAAKKDSVLDLGQLRIDYFIRLFKLWPTTNVLLVKLRLSASRMGVGPINLKFNVIGQLFAKQPT